MWLSELSWEELMPRVSCWRESWPQRDSRRALLRVIGLVDGGVWGVDILDGVGGLEEMVRRGLLK